MSDITTRLHLDRGEKLIHAERVQDVEPILERNKLLQTIPQKSDWGRHIASIPNVVIEMWLTEEHKRGNKSIEWGSKEFDALIARRIRDPEWRYLRVDK